MPFFFNRRRRDADINNIENNNSAPQGMSIESNGANGSASLQFDRVYRDPTGDDVRGQATLNHQMNNHATADSQQNGVTTVVSHDPADGPTDVQVERQLLVDRISHLSPSTDAYATEFVDGLLDFAVRSGASDVHLQPTSEGFDVRFRDDGILKPLGIFAAGARTSIVSRLKVLANLLTYQSDVPQEGRIAVSSDVRRGGEARMSTFPTLHGERAVLRFFGHQGQYQHLDQLGHRGEIVGLIRDSLAETSGALLICGPAGSGKSTTLYAALRYLIEATGGTRSILSVEDPVEVPLAGVSQSQVNSPAGFDLHTALKSLLRQDPEIFCVGEIRDPVTAEIALQACLAGQLMLATFHADSVATAITRLIDMGIDPYQMRSGLIGILCQRLVRKLCECGVWTDDEGSREGWSVDRVRIAGECGNCFGTGYSGRTIISEFLPLHSSQRCDELIGTNDSRAIYRAAVEGGMRSLWEDADQLIRDGVTSPLEIRRVLGRTMRI